MTSVSKPTHASTIAYMDLYARWEASNWSAVDIDFTQDRADWQTLSELERDAIIWLCSLFYTGEDQVTDDLGPFAGALDREEQLYVLTTQQVDEARHSVFFHRFFTEVVGQDGDLTQTLRAAQRCAAANSAFATVVTHLDAVTAQLARRPSPRALAAAITNYHLIVEGTIAQQGQGLLTEHMCMGRLPGLRAGLTQIEHDERRHIAFGLKLLDDLLKDHPQAARAGIFDTLSRLAPHLAGLIYPPEPAYLEVFGIDRRDVIAAGFRSLTTKLAAVGLTASEIPGWVIPITLTDPYAIADRVQLLEQHGVIATPYTSAGPLNDTGVALLAEAIARSAAPRRPLYLEVRARDRDQRHVFLIAPSNDPQPAGARTSVDVRLSADADDLAKLARGTGLPRSVRVSGSAAGIRALPTLFPAASQSVRAELARLLRRVPRR